MKSFIEIKRTWTYRHDTVALLKEHLVFTGDDVFSWKQAQNRWDLAIKLCKEGDYLGHELFETTSLYEGPSMCVSFFDEWVSIDLGETVWASQDDADIAKSLKIILDQYTKTGKSSFVNKGGRWLAK
jgi:hypothetical protein